MIRDSGDEEKLAKCIRCGKPCASGENMCDECKAWFQEKTGGSVVSGVKRSIPPQKDNKDEKVNKSATPEAKQEVQQEIPNVGETKEQSKQDTKINELPSKKGGNIVLSKKMLYIIGAGVVAVIVIVILFVTIGGHNKNNEAENYYDGTDDVYQEENDNWDDEDTCNEEYGNKPENTVPENVTRIWSKYQDQVDSYYHNDNLESSPVEIGYVYYLNDELIEVNYETDEYRGIDYYYDDGEVYFALCGDDGNEDKLFYESGSLIYWIDSDGNNHEASEAEECWGYTVDDAETLYYTYSDKSVVGFGETAEYILPNSNSEYISESDLYGLSEWEVRIARNEIMARHGRRFKDQFLQDYFDSCSWYYGAVSPEEFDKNYESNLNEYEKKNATTIKEYEKKQGYNQ